MEKHFKNKYDFDVFAKEDGIDIDALAAEIEGAGASKEQGKGKGKKKKGGKKEDYDEDDILKELEELSLENQGGKGKEPPKVSHSDMMYPLHAVKNLKCLICKSSQPPLTLKSLNKIQCNQLPSEST
uniref:Uncharacterized protein n=1 Tax=Astyanax mexicanus TaxID=7994 RepID=A0A8B9LY48_ASTMX